MKDKDTQHTNCPHDPVFNKNQHDVIGDKGLNADKQSHNSAVNGEKETKNTDSDPVFVSSEKVYVNAQVNQVDNMQTETKSQRRRKAKKLKDKLKKGDLTTANPSSAAQFSEKGNNTAVGNQNSTEDAENQQNFTQRDNLQQPIGLVNQFDQVLDANLHSPANNSVVQGAESGKNSAIAKQISLGDNLEHSRGENEGSTTLNGGVARDETNAPEGGGVGDISESMKELSSAPVGGTLVGGVLRGWIRRSYHLEPMVRLEEVFLTDLVTQKRT